MKKFICLATILILPVSVQEIVAQDNYDNDESNTVKEEKKKPDHNHQMYLKAGLDHVGTSIEGFDIVVNGLNIELETYFNKNHLGLSGWSVGYRKDDVRQIDFGHFFNLGVFREMAVPMVGFKFGGG